MIAILLPALLGCIVAAPDSAPDPRCGETDAGQTGVVSSLLFAREVDGVSEGFDFDGAVTREGDASGCGIPDYVDARGNEGIDNVAARLVPVLETTEAAAAEGLVQGAIKSGEILITFTTRGIDDLEDDACVTVDVGRATGTPSLGTDGMLEWSQTYDRDPDTAPVRVHGVAQGGSIVTEPFDFELPIQVLNASAVFRFYGGRMRITPQEDGSFLGVLGGPVPSADITAVAGTDNVDAAVASLVANVMAILSDSLPDEQGVCTGASMNFEWTGVPGFYFGE